jgi:hypothetical protein
VEAGWAGQAALVVVGRFFLGFLVGFLIAGWRTAGPRRAETFRMLLRPAQGPGLRAYGPPPCNQEAAQQAQEQAAQDRKGHLTGPARLHAR